MPTLNPGQFDKVQRVSPQHLMETAHPADDPSWDENRRYIQENHFKGGGRMGSAWGAFVDDVSRRGVRRPIIVHDTMLRGQPGLKVTNGHHRLLAADMTGRETVPVIVRKKYRRS